MLSSSSAHIHFSFFFLASSTEHKLPPSPLPKHSLRLLVFQKTRFVLLPHPLKLLNIFYSEGGGVSPIRQNPTYSFFLNFKGTHTIFFQGNLTFSKSKRRLTLTVFFLSSPFNKTPPNITSWSKRSMIGCSLWPQRNLANTPCPNISRSK